MARALVKNASDAYPQNFIINGGFDFWQRATSGSSGNTAAYVTADRWMFESGGSGSHVQTRVTNVPNTQLRYSLNYTHSTANICRSWQRIEAQNIAPMVGKTVCLSAWIRVVSGDLQNLILSFWTPTGGIDTWSTDFAADTQEFSNAVTTPTVANGWVRISQSFLLPASASNGLAIQIRTQTSTAGTVCELAGVMLTEGTQPPTTFYRAGKTIEAELALCQRYYEKSYVLSAPPPTVDSNGLWISRAATTTSVNSNLNFNVSKRVAPTMTFYSRAGTLNTFTADNATTDTAVTLTAAVVTEFGITGAGVSGASVGAFYRIHWVASAEL